MSTARLMSTARQWDDRVGRRLKLRDLYILMTVAHCGGIGKAAVQLSVSQPAVSKAIANMEHTLGVRLLDRTALGVEPTLYGSALLKWGATVFDDLRQGVKEIEYLADPTAGEVRIGSTEPMTAGLVPAVIDRLSGQFPRLVFDVMQASALVLQYRDLRERSIDLILGRMVTPIADEDLNVQTLFNDPLFVVSALSERQQFLVFPRYNPASGYRPIFGVRKQEVEGLKRLTKREDIAVYARKQGLRWYLLNPEDTLSWPLALLERPVYSSGGYRVYKLY